MDFSFLKRLFGIGLSDDFYSKKNLFGSNEHVSTTGRYKLIVRSYCTGKDTWAVTSGEIHDTKKQRCVALVKRNYSQFPFAWVEAHPNGHDYIVCGEDYQG